MDVSVNLFYKLMGSAVAMLLLLCSVCGFLHLLLQVGLTAVLCCPLLLSSTVLCCRNNTTTAAAAPKAAKAAAVKAAAEDLRFLNYKLMELRHMWHMLNKKQ